MSPATVSRVRFARSLLVLACTAALVLIAAGSALGDVTGAADDLRTGWYPEQPSLTPSAVAKGGGFEEVFERKLQGQIYAQPLTANGTLLVVTEDDWAYGIDPNTGGVRWQKQFGTPVNALEAPINCTDLAPHIGITSTPVIDTASGVAYFVANQYVSGGTGPIAWYMHAVALTNGEERPGFPVRIEGQAENLPGVQFEAAKQLQRPALLLSNGVVYAGFGSHCDTPRFEGWLAGVTTEGSLTTMWAAASEGASIWQSGGGLISDGPGQILFSTGNGWGPFGESDPPVGPGSKPPNGRLGESVVRVKAQPGGGIEATDFFSPFNSAELDEKDEDLGSSAPIALPSPYFGTAAVPHLLVQSGKQGYVYLLNRDRLGGRGEKTNDVLQTLGPYGGVWDGSAVWPGDGGYVYLPGTDRLRSFKYGVTEKGQPALSPAAATNPEAESFGFGTGAPIVTSNATLSGSAILWTIRCPHPGCAGAQLAAYDPAPVGNELRALASWPVGAASKFSRPDASNGHIFVGDAEGRILGYSVPALAASAGSLDLGTTALGEQHTAEVTFTNTGTPLKVSSVREPSPPFSASGLPTPAAKSSRVKPSRFT